jgi:hypothetical protein
MKERFKTLLLILLVSISVFVTQSLWFEIPSQVFGDTERPKIESSSSTLSEMISPNQYLLNFNEKNHTLLYDDKKYGLWDESQKYLNKLISSKIEDTKEITKEEYILYEEKRSVIFYFAETINTYILSKAWGVDDPNKIVDAIPNIDSIYIYLGNDDPFFIMSNEETHLLFKVENIDLENLKLMVDKIDKKGEYPYYHSMRKTLNIDNDIYIPYEMKTSLPIVYVSNGVKSLNQSDRIKMAEHFLNKDIDYITEIMEGNGSSIYIHEQRFLKLNTNGIIEYFHPLEKRIKDRNLYTSLSKAANFIKNNTALSRDIHLVDIEEIKSDESLGYKFMFRYRVRGIPVILGNQKVDEYIQMEVFNSHVKSYKYYAREEIEMSTPILSKGENILSAFDVIDKNYKKFKNLYKSKNTDILESLMDEDKDLVEEILSSVDAITFAYFDPGLKEIEERLVPVWVVRFNNRILAFDAVTGSLVFEK